MKRSLFIRLAGTGISKNRRLYIPYILSCVGTIAMFFILCALSYSSILKQAEGGENIAVFLSLGKFVIGVFAVLFLFYTNSFLIKSRYGEFGLYNVLGMDKLGISKIVMWESLITSSISLAGGIFIGAVLYKLSELALLKAIRAEVVFGFSLSGEALKYTFLIFIPIFLLLALKSLVTVGKLKPIELLKTEKTGEKPPRANHLLAAAGIVILGAAYWLSVSIKSPLTTMFTFFIAVIMVVAATYLIFISASVSVCRILKSRKGYYYKKNHFVSVSFMAYRMKRNGAGLASICILSTMVLVMISSSASLYFGADDSLQSIFPRDNMVTVYFRDIDSFTNENSDILRSEYELLESEHRAEASDVYEYRCAVISGSVSGDRLIVEPEITINAIAEYESLRQVFFVSQDDYNAAVGSDIRLEGNDVLLSSVRCEYGRPVLIVEDLELNIIGRPDDFPEIPAITQSFIPALCVVIRDYDLLRPLERYMVENENVLMLDLQYSHSYNTPLEGEAALDLLNTQSSTAARHDFLQNDAGDTSTDVSCLSVQRDDFFGTYGSLFFIGIMLSVLFIFAAAMIIYYKQISEGYEDKARFAIMQKVGMTEADIKKSINSQVLTVFFAPLAMSCLHIAFAFPPIWKMLQLFNLHNLKLVIFVTICSAVMFAMFYAIIYKLTAAAYFRIVSRTDAH